MDLVSYEELIGDVNENEMGHGGGYRGTIHDITGIAQKPVNPIF
jgi:hypothetical protein